MTDTGVVDDLVSRIVWDRIRSQGRRPTVHDIDRALYRDHGIHADLLPVLSRDGFNLSPLVVGPNLPAGALVGVTAAHVHALGLATRELSLFLTVIRQAADREREFEPTRPGEPAQLTAADVIDHLCMTGSDTKQVMAAVGELLRASPCGCTIVAGNDPLWTLQISREVRRYVGMPNMDSYMRLIGGPDRIAPHFDGTFWTALSAVFAVLALLVSALQVASVSQATSGTIAAVAAFLAVYRRRRDRWTFLYTIGAVLAAGYLAMTLWP
ncbi:hypothetical protein [Streptosporangium saharense]|uniref:hypothetical protein n=1 Tax=Streptosporangium saharense TaxID=1706840 RepID=UPI00331A27E1